MAAEITQRDLRARSGHIMDAVAHGESFVVTRNGTPIGELIPLRRDRVVTREQFAGVSANAAERARRMDVLQRAESEFDLPLYTTNPDDFAGLDTLVTVVTVPLP